MPTPNADGPDISHWQKRTGPFDPRWRLGSAKASEGRIGRDKDFFGHFAWTEGARWRGGYHWLRSDSSMAAQAANFISRMDQATGSKSLPVGVMLQTDWEVTPGIPLVTSDSVIEFNDRLRQHYGRDCVITYSSDWLPDSTLDADSRREFDEWRQARPSDPYWHANYNTSTKPDGGWAESAKYDADVWQWSATFVHTSIDNGTKGFDMNHVWKPETLDRICGYAHKPITPPETITPEVPKMGKTFKADDGDVAEFCVVGGIAKWIKDPTHRNFLRFAGLLDNDPANLIARADLLKFSLVGPAPVYPPGYTGPRTTTTSFA